MHPDILAVSLALAGSAVANAIPGTITRTSVFDLYTTDLPAVSSTIKGDGSTCCSSSSSLPHPSDWDRNYKQDEVLKDTRKHHSSFKLFAYPAAKSAHNDEYRFPVHVLEHPQRPDIWNLQLARPHTSDKQDEDQPKWNLAKGSLETDGSAPIKDTLYFRLWEAKPQKATANWPPHVYREVLTTNSHKKKYIKENNAKLVAKDGWTLVRDGDNPAAYLLAGSKPKGSFWACPTKPRQPKALRARAEDEEERPEMTEEEFAEGMHELEGLMRNFTHIVPSAVEHNSSPVDNSPQVDDIDVVFSDQNLEAMCHPIIIKAEGWVNKQKQQ